MFMFPFSKSVESSPIFCNDYAQKDKWGLNTVWAGTFVGCGEKMTSNAGPNNLSDI